MDTKSNAEISCSLKNVFRQYTSPSHDKANIHADIGQHKEFSTTLNLERTFSSYQKQ